MGLWQTHRHVHYHPQGGPCLGRLRGPNCISPPIIHVSIKFFSPLFFFLIFLLLWSHGVVFLPLFLLQYCHNAADCIDSLSSSFLLLYYSTVASAVLQQLFLLLSSSPSFSLLCRPAQIKITKSLGAQIQHLMTS